jgi:hypothetical protein
MRLLRARRHRPRRPCAKATDKCASVHLIVLPAAEKKSGRKSKRAWRLNLPIEYGLIRS